ncbi:MAG: acetate kinase [Lachnospiraceae bacterium]|nr:acetate kinase [Lachnospiraceae bacterium]
MNCGSSSLKYQIINMKNEEVLAKGLAERIGSEMGRVVYEPTNGEKIVIDKPLPDHEVALRTVIDELTDKEHGVIGSLKDIDAVGHRVVHGGETLIQPVLLTKKIVDKIEDIKDMAPLHNPAHVIGMRVCQSLIKGVPEVACFDTAFHSTIPEKAYLFGLPYEYYTDYKVRKYGFHGISHSYVSQKAAKMLGKPYSRTKTIVCHLGNGASVSAVQNGKCVDTSMGFTPLDGLIMGTRSGSVDASALGYVMDKTGIDMHEMVRILNRESGMKGMTGFTDFRDIEAGMNEGNEACKRGMEAFCYRVAKTIGSYVAAMNGVDDIVFTAGIGENSATVRKLVCEYLGYLGVKLDARANKKRGDARMITTEDSVVKVFVIPTNEELMIARETVALVKNKK